jgi:hypothetical protein
VADVELPSDPLSMPAQQRVGVKVMQSCAQSSVMSNPDGLVDIAVGTFRRNINSTH